MSEWNVGDIAICVDDRDPPGWEGWCPLKHGHAYTVIAVVMAAAVSPFSRDTHQSLRLLEVRNGIHPLDCFDARRFVKRRSLLEEEERETSEELTA